MTTGFYTNGEYTGDISNKMKVPDKILVHNDSGDWNQAQTHDHRDVFNMQVPDRIQFTGSKQNVTHLMPDNIPAEHVRAKHPRSPSSITLADLAFQTADDPLHFSPPKKIRLRKRQDSISTYMEQNISPSEEIQLMKSQIAKLNHRLMATQLENQQRQKRKLVMAIAASTYFLVKAFVWIKKSI